MIWFIEFAVLCILFTVLILSSLRKDLLANIASYPPEIQDRVKSLPQYSHLFTAKMRRNIAKKIIAAILLCAVFAAVAYFSSARTFPAAFIYVFSLFFALNLYDVIVLDILIFCHSKWVRIPGTEDMEKAYRSPWYHIKGGIKGVLIGTAVAAAAAGIVLLLP